ncbi:MAG: GTPase Era [Clostridia bacterium]|nr:GTPase Era [Clostridia bacterium]
MFKSGYIGVIGNTNAGKSTLVNALVGQKVSIVSPKKQTTRNNILGILTKENFQLVFVDTPGIHKTKNNLDKSMMKNVRSAISSVDAVLYILDANKDLGSEEFDYIKKLTDLPLVVGISKVDISNQEKVFKIIAKLSSIKEISAIVPFSSIKNTNLDIILEEILKILPEESEKNLFFEEEMYTDQSTKFMVAEIIREKALLLLNEELPYGAAIEITKYTEKNDLLEIDADFICEKERHKAIIIGKGGLMLKQIGSQARLDIENLVQKKVMLKIWVKVNLNWRQNKNFVV